MRKILSLISLVLILASCGRQSGDDLVTKLDTPRPHERFEIRDSSRIQTLTSGLKFYLVQEGPGEFPRPGSRIVMDYVGMLEDGTVFDNSYERSEPFAFTLGHTDVIMGMAEGISLMRYGSKAILIVPPSLGYGDEELPNIPPNSTLYFHIDLLGSF